MLHTTRRRHRSRLRCGMPSLRKTPSACLILVFWMVAGCTRNSKSSESDAMTAFDAAPQCSYDCECPEGLPCNNGTCDGTAGRFPSGICGSRPSATCPCVGGTCTAMGCCVLADGAIDPGSGPACSPEFDASPVNVFGPDAQPQCSYGCECPTGIPCNNGICDTTAQGGCLAGICGTLPGARCPCTGGMCTAMGCCILPDGGIDPGDGPA